MSVNNRILRVFKAVALLFLLSSSTLYAQNLITNGEFENTTFNYQTISDYTRIWGGGILEGQFIHDVTSTDHGGGGAGLQPNLTGYGGSGYYLLFNGFGNNTNATKAAWRQTVTVTTNTTYTFSAQVRNLSRPYMGISHYPAIMRLKINNQWVSENYPLPSGYDWQEWQVTWNSGSATQALIEIYDVYDNNPGYGDDFGIDHISFAPDVVYSVVANNDIWPLACQGTPVEIPVLDNDIISPGLQGLSVQIVSGTGPAHGEAYYLSSSHKIEYICLDNSFTGTDSFKYRVGYAAQNIFDEAWVFVTVGQPPTVANISTPGPICAGGVLGISTPTVNPSGLAGRWEKSTSQNGPFQVFDPTNIPLSMNGNWIRYSVANDCGEGHSNAVQITVTEGPSFTGQTPQLQPICAGDNLNLAIPGFNANGSQILSQGWVASPTATGEYSSFSLTNISSSYNGWYIRYMIEGSCGYVYSDPPHQLTVNVAPDITGTIQAPQAICDGDDLNITPPAYDGNGTGVWEICQTQNGNYQSFNIQNVPATYNNWYLHYKVSNDCGSDVSNAVQIHVNDAPTIATPATPQAICAGSSFSLTTPTIQNNGATITDQGWQIAATQNGSYSAFNNNNVPYAYNGYWIRYFAENECGETHSASVQVTVNDGPLVGAIVAPPGICAGESFALTVPQVTWRHVNQGTGSWEIQINGVWQTLNNSNIPFNYDGCSIRYKAVNGCGTAYSTNNVQVTVYSTEPTYDTIMACDTYVWNGVTCSSTGNYQATVQNENGCTITAHLRFILSDAYTETQSFTSCESFFWPVNGQTYYASCMDSYTIESGDPLVCDSVFTLNLTINYAPEIVSDLQAPNEICSSDFLNVTPPQYAMNQTSGGTTRWDYATSPNGPFHAFDPSTYHLEYGTYYLRFVVINSCDSTFSNVVQFHVNGTPEIEGQLSAFQVCENNPLNLPEVDVEWRNSNVNDRISEWQMANAQNGTYAAISPTMPMQMSHNGCWIRYYAHTSCGTDILGPVPITVISAEDQWLETITACDVYQLESGEVITESQIVEYEVLEPCYHVIHQPVVINHSDYVVEPITSCHEEEVWHGRTFYYSEQTQYAWDTLTNIYQCDSVVELNLNFDEFSSYTHNRIACGSYEWEMNPGHIYYETQRDSVFIPAVGEDDCDTWYFLELTVGHDTLIEGGAMTECSGFVWHGVPYFEDAVLYDSLQTAVTHCDSVYYYTLTIIPPLTGEENIVSCLPIWWQEHYCEEEGDYQHAFISSLGCDSIVTMHFNLADEIVNTFDTVACEPFTWFEYECNTNGMTCSHVFTTPMGCDSTVIKRVFLNATDLSTQFITACDSYEYNGVVYDEIGEHYINLDTILSHYGCDSIINRIHLEIKDSNQIGPIIGLSNVFVASNLVNGIYRYEIDPNELQGDVVWSLSNGDWMIVDAQDNYCHVFVATPGVATLTARFNTPECGEIVREFEINAAFFGVNDQPFVEANVFPNPTKGTVTVEAEGIQSLRLTNMMGQVLELREEGCSDSVILNLSGYAPSVYLLEIKTVNGMAKKRLVLCR